MRTSLCMIARDEEAMLGPCLESARDQVDEIILVDTGSRDGTIELARRLGAQVFEFPWQDDFSAARNHALEHATGDWILVLDCDERLEAASRDGIREATAGSRYEGYLLRMCSGADEWYALRLYRNRPDTRYYGRIHEQLRFPGPAARGSATIRHLGYDPALLEQKRDRNARLIEAALAETAGASPDRHSFYLFYHAFGADGAERAARLGRWVQFVEAHPELERPPARPWIPVGLAHYAWQLSDAGAHAEAEVRARRLLGRHGESPLLHLLLARARAESGDRSAAERHLAGLESGRSAEAYHYFPIDYGLLRRRGQRLLGEIREREGRLAEAERCYRRLLDQDPADLPAALRLVCVLVQMGAYRQALDALEAFPALLDQGLAELDCLGFALTLILHSTERIAPWSRRVQDRARRSPLAAQMLQRVSQWRARAPFRLSDFPELEQGIRLS